MRRLFGVEGLACAGCARGLEGRLRGLPHIHSVGVHYLSSSAMIDWDADALKVADIEATVTRAGYRLIERQRPEEVLAALSAESDRLALRLVVALFAGMWSMAPAMVLYFGDMGAAVNWWLALVSGIFALPVVFWAGRGFFWMAWRSILLRAPGMDLLISLGALSAVLLSCWMLVQGRSDVWFDTATMLIIFLLLGRLLDLHIRRSAAEALQAMEAASPEMAVIKRDGKSLAVPVTDLPLGTQFTVDAGAAIPLDGIILEGESLINRAILSGESRLIPVAIGQRVEAGSINSARRLTIASDRLFGSREIDLMGGAVAIEMARKGASANRADIWAARLSVAIPLLALVTMLGGMLTGIAFEEALLRGVTLLVAACPCALSIALPLAGLRAAQEVAKIGIRLRDPEAFAQLGRLKSLVFDKTGTLTEGQPLVAQTRRCPDGPSPDEILRFAAAAETGIDHPIAKAIIAAHGREEGRGGLRQERAAELVSEGITVATAQAPPDDKLTWLDVTQHGKLIGQIGLSDVLRGETSATLTALRHQGLQLSIASGDSKAATQTLGRQLGFEESHIHGGLRPMDKVKILAAQAKPCGYVGDGVNDGPALTSADCGISVASAHSAAAQTADVVIMRGGLDRILPAMNLSRRLRAISGQNLMLSSVYNIAILPLAATGLIGPASAALAMFASSLSVLLNTLRLRKTTR